MFDGEIGRYEARAEVIKALAHPVRLLMVDELGKGEKCVCELTEKSGLDISTISRHLLLLRNAGLVKSRKEGTKVIYALNCPCTADFLSCVERVVNNRSNN